MDVETEIVDGLGWIWINRPDVSNAVRPETMKLMCEALDRFTADDKVDAIILAGRGGHFAAGGDFDFLQSKIGNATLEVMQELYQYFQGATRRLFYCPKPTVAAVMGAAITVGCELAIACDIRVAATSAFFQESWLRMGLLSPLGGALTLPRLIGLGRAKEMMLEARKVPADEALRIGLVSEVVEPDQLYARATARAKGLTQFPKSAYKAMKESLNRGLDSTMEHEWAANVMAQSMLIGSADFCEAVTAIKEKRKPVFKK